MLGQINRSELIGMQIREDLCSWVVNTEGYVHDSYDLGTVKIAQSQEGLPTSGFVVCGRFGGSASNEQLASFTEG